MGRFGLLLVLLSGLAAGAFAQKPTVPANETRTPGPVRSPHSMNGDWTVPLCPARFDDSLDRNGIAGPRDKDVSRPTISKSVPAAITQQAITAGSRTHSGNYIVIVNVVVDKKGVPGDLCLQKSSGYGLDAAAAAAVPQYRFHPATRNGEPVAIRVPVEVRFESQNPPTTPHPIPVK